MLFKETTTVMATEEGSSHTGEKKSLECLRGSVKNQKQILSPTDYACLRRKNSSAARPKPPNAIVVGSGTITANPPSVSALPVIAGKAVPTEVVIVNDREWLLKVEAP